MRHYAAHLLLASSVIDQSDADSKHSSLSLCSNNAYSSELSNVVRKVDRMVHFSKCCCL